MASDGAALLAVAVLRLAVEDSRSASPRVRDSARRFLMAPDRHEDRAFWCALAGVDDAALSATVRAEMRMADEIDKKPSAQGRRSDFAQDSDEVVPTVEELGISRQRLAEWRDVRDAGPAVTCV